MADARLDVAKAGPDLGAARPFEKQTVVLDSNIICWRHLSLIPQQDALRTLYAAFSAGVSVPLDLSVYWPEFGLYGMTETDGASKRASYYATFPLLQLLGGQTQGATLISGVLDDQIEVYELRPADGRAPTFVIWSRDDQPHEVKVRLSATTGIQLLESPTAAAPTIPSTICAGSSLCSLSVTDVPLYISGTDSLEFVH